MKKVLIINSSAGMLNSQSRQLTEVFVEHWKAINETPVIRFRDLGNTDVPHISEKWIVAAFKPEKERSEEEIEVLKTSDAYIAELQEADVLVLGSPMYNWSVPSALKAYIDQILRVNETFRKGNIQDSYVGLLENITLLLLLSRGSQGYEKGEHNEHMNFQGTYLKTVFNIMAVNDIHLIAIERGSLTTEDFKISIDIAREKIRKLVEKEFNIEN